MKATIAYALRRLANRLSPEPAATVVNVYGDAKAHASFRARDSRQPGTVGDC